MDSWLSCSNVLEIMINKCALVEMWFLHRQLSLLKCVGHSYYGDKLSVYNVYQCDYYI